MQGKINGLPRGIGIGVIGPEPLVQKMEEVMQSFPSFYPELGIYKNEDEIEGIARDLMHRVEVLLFAEHHTYRRVMGKIDFSIPVHYVPNKGSGLYSALFRLKKRTELNRLSIDTISVQALIKAMEELEEEYEHCEAFSFSRYPTSEELLKFHTYTYTSGKCSGVLTGILAVSEELTQRNIPNEWITPSEQDIIITLERALLSTETRKNKEAQIVVGLINVDDFSTLVRNTYSEHELQKLKLEINRLLLDYVKCLDGHLTNLGGDEYLFVTTRGIFERETRGYKFLPVLQESKNTLGITLSIGVGFGQSANEAGTHARLALRQSKEAGGNLCYIVREDRSVIGPVEMGPPMVYDLAITDEVFLAKAEKAGMTATYMSKLMAQVKRLGKMEYTAQELATVLGITVRSTHRILNQWLDAGLVEIVGNEKITTKGRPRQIWCLSPPEFCRMKEGERK